MSLGGSWMSDYDRGYNSGASAVREELRAEIAKLRAEIELLTGNKWSEIELAMAEYRAKRLHERLFGSDECGEAKAGGR